MTTTLLLIVLLTPSGEKREVLAETFATRTECRAEKAATHATLLADRNGWKLVSADCAPEAKNGR